MLTSRKQLFICVLGAILLAMAPASAQNPQNAASDVNGSRQQSATSDALRKSTAESMVAAAEALDHRPFDAAYRNTLIQGLASMPDAQLQAIPPGGVSLGESAKDLVYTPVTPCRIIDTRSGSPIPAGGQQTFFAAGLCGIPFGPATAVVVNFIAVAPAGPGDLRAFAAGGSVPNASILNYANVPGLNIANGLVVPICDPSKVSCPTDVTIQADVSATHVVADVLGYFSRFSPSWGVVNSDGTLARSSHVTSAAHLGVGSYEVIFDRDVTPCTFLASIGNAGTGVALTGQITTAARSGNVNGVFLATTDAAGTVADRPFHLIIGC